MSTLTVSEPDPAGPAAVPTARPLTMRQRWRRRRLGAYCRLLALACRLVEMHPAVWRVTVRHYRSGLDRLAAATARAVCALAAVDVLAYRDFLARNGAGRHRALADFPATDKDSYVDAYGQADRCWRGRLPAQRVVVDESAGSSGRPCNWPRGAEELASVHRAIAGYTSLVHPAGRRLVINAYSMGAWATGTTTGARPRTASRRCVAASR